MYIYKLADGTRVQARSPLDSAILPEENDDTSDDNPDHTSVSKPGDESGYI